MSIGLHVQYPLFSSDLNETCTLQTDFQKNPQIQNFMKIHPTGANLNRAGGQMDRHDEANSRFSQFCKRTWTLKYFEKHLKHLKHRV
jgi:hypothetical protein